MGRRRRIMSRWRRGTNCRRRCAWYCVAASTVTKVTFCNVQSQASFGAGQSRLASLSPCTEHTVCHCLTACHFATNATGYLG